VIRQVRRVAAVLFVLFAALFVNLNYLQVLRADELADDPRNSRGLVREYARQRGSMIVGAGPEAVEIAKSVETDDRLRFLRVYSDGPLYAHVTGYYSFIYGREQLERTFNDFLVGSAPETFARNLGDLLAGKERQGDDLVLPLRPSVQAAARAALGDRRGAVVALDPVSGEVLALYSNPSYDPNALASHDRSEILAAWEATEADPANPRLNRATRELYPPGSTFKLVTAAAALRAGVTADTTFEDRRVLDLPQSDAGIGNFGGGLCNRGRPLTLAQALAVSCNTTFGQLGLDVGAEALIAQAEQFGFNRDWNFQLPLETSRIPKELDAPSTAQSAIGQRDVRATPLQMALVAAAIGNDGILVTPHVVTSVQDFAGRVIKQFPPAPLVLPGADSAQALPPGDAAVLRDLMVGVVERGSGQRAAIPGVRVAGKTGTAETGEGRAPTVWFVGFAPAEEPRVAVAVVIEDGGDVPGGPPPEVVPGRPPPEVVPDEATGGRIAAPIARAVMEAALAQTSGEDSPDGG
jgi:peptidoglycan glycosyltransferase